MKPSVRPARERWSTLLSAPRRLSTILGLLALILVFYLLAPDRFLSPANIVTIVKQGAVLTILASGLTIVLVMGEFDLSIGAVASLGGMLATGFMVNQGLGTPLALIGALLGGGAVGLANGLVVTRLRVNAFIATLARG